MSETPCGTMSIHNRFINSSEVATYLSVGAGVTFSSWLSVAGDVTFSSSLSVSNSVTLSSRLSVASNVTMSSSLSVSDDVTLSSRLSAASDVTVSSSLSVSNRVVMSSTLSVANHVQLSSHLSVAGSADITGRVYQATHMLVPPGSVVAYISTSAPGGWLLCDGSNVSRTTYATLFSVIGTTFGVGDGSTTFTLPDMRGRVPVGSGSGAGLTARSLAATGGEETHTLTVPEIPAHTHSYTDTYRTGNQDTDNAFGTETVANESSVSEAKTTGSTGGGQAHNIMQPFLVLNYIIKY